METGVIGAICFAWAVDGGCFWYHGVVSFDTFFKM